MVATDPRTNQRRLRWERLIWCLDMGSYLLMAFSGFIALFYTSDFVVREVRSREAIILWGVLLLAGGLAGFAGRLTRLWVVEILGNVSAASGAVIYLLIIVTAVLGGSSLVLFGFVTAAYIAMVRRYSELQIFTSEPGLDTFTARVQSLLRRRTTNTVQRKHY
jgi:hypothetical protein